MNTNTNTNASTNTNANTNTNTTTPTTATNVLLTYMVELILEHNYDHHILEFWQGINLIFLLMITPSLPKLADLGFTMGGSAYSET